MPTFHRHAEFSPAMLAPIAKNLPDKLERGWDDCDEVSHCRRTIEQLRAFSLYERRGCEIGRCAARSDNGLFAREGRLFCIRPAAVAAEPVNPASREDTPI